MIFLGQLAGDKVKTSLEGPSFHPGNTSQINPMKMTPQCKITKHTHESQQIDQWLIRHVRVHIIKRPIKTCKISLFKNIEDIKGDIK